MNPRRLLTIAGSDPSGGAGIQADLKTFGALDSYGMSVITALTAQNTVGVRSIFSVSPAFVGDQIDAIFEDIGADAVKIGMLDRKEMIEIVANRLRHYRVSKTVLDPVMVAKSGAELLQKDAIESLKENLFSLVTLITPNLPEASVLLSTSIRTKKEMEEAAKALSDLGKTSILLKGGHLESDVSDDCLYLFTEKRTLWFSSERIQTQNTHGTGCTLSSAIATYLAHGMDIPTAVQKAKIYLTQALKAGALWRLGRGHGPLNHFFNNQQQFKEEM